MAIFGEKKEKPIPQIIRLPRYCGKVFDIFVDTETGVNYLRYKFSLGQGGGGGLTVRVNTEGKPIISTPHEIAAAIENFKTGEAGGHHW